MQTVVWLVVVLVIVLVGAAVGAGLRQRRSTQLRERFGPEYERAVDAADSPREARQMLSERERRRAELEIVPLSEPVRLRYAEQWRDVQERFVDHPAQSVDAAQHLLEAVMTDRGYPTNTVEEQADLVSVDHPHVVQNYRVAHDIHRRMRQSDAGPPTTENLREALVRYRLLFDELLAPASGDAAAYGDGAHLLGHDLGRDVDAADVNGTDPTRNPTRNGTDPTRTDTTRRAQP